VIDHHSAVAQQIDAVFADMDIPSHPGAALMVIEDGAVLYQRGYGLASLEANTPITPHSSFYLASVSKQFTALAVMLLAEQGKLRYDDPLHQYFPKFPAWAAGITIRHLIHHTSGLPEYFPLFSPNIETKSILEWSRDVQSVTSMAVLNRVMQEQALLSPVGEKWEYCNSGYVLLALIVEAAAAQPYAQFMRERIFAPLGMAHTLVYDETHPTPHKLAQGYVEVDGAFQRWQYPLLTAGDGGTFSTLNDLFLWNQALHTEKLVSFAALQQAFTPGTTNDGASTHYAFGWMDNVYEGKRHVAHGGSLGAYNNYIIRFLDAPRTIIVLTNYPGNPGPRIRAHQVADILFTD
jgi:CubicO group peptidase (beta-lactamase class C family)